MSSHIIADHLKIKRIYAPVAPDDGKRILVDRLWPRGVSKARAALAGWHKDVAPSTELRHWFGHKVEHWASFQEKYRAELAHNSEAVEVLRALAREEPVTLLFGARDEAHNEAVVLKAFLSGDENADFEG